MIFGIISIEAAWPIITALASVLAAVSAAYNKVALAHISDLRKFLGDERNDNAKLARLNEELNKDIRVIYIRKAEDDREVYLALKDVLDAQERLHDDPSNKDLLAEIRRIIEEHE